MKLFKNVGVQCPKCTGKSVGAQFVTNIRISGEIVEEHLWWTCKICGYSWHTHPADFDDTDHAS